MHLVNILLTVGLIVLVSGITILALCAVIASSRPERTLIANQSKQQERRKNTTCSFPVNCADGTRVYFDRRLRT